MSADAITPVGPDFDLTPSAATPSDGSGGGAGRGGSQNGAGSPLVVVQQPRNAAPPRPAPRRNQSNTGNSLRNGYAAISHSVSGETAAIGLGFLLAGPAGAIAGGAALPVLAAASVWRARRREHDANTNSGTTGTGTNSGSGRDRSGSGSSGSGGGRGNSGGGRHRSLNGSDGGRHKTPKSPKTSNGNRADGGTNRKPKVKDPVADKLAKTGKGLTDKLKNRNKTDKAPKNGKHDGADDSSGKGSSSTDPNGKTGKKDPKTPKNGKGRKWLKDRGPQPDSPKPWAGRGDKPKKDRRKKKGCDDDASSTTARDALEPTKPKNGDGASADEPEILDAELVDDNLPPKPDQAPDDVIDGEVIDEDRIALVRAKREKKRRRDAITIGRKAAEKAARDGNIGDPRRVKFEVIRQANHHVDLALHHEEQLLALTAAAEKPRSTPVNYPAIQAAPTSPRTAGAVVARQIDFRGTTAFAILRAMADQLAHGLHSDDDADMADHVVELTGIPNMCKNLSTAVQEAARALARTAPLHPSVIKHLNNAAVAARTAGVMAENIMTVFVQAHRQDIIRVLDPRIGEERWNIRNAPGTLDAAKLRAAIASAHSARLALPAGSSSGQGGSKLVPASDGSTKKLIDLMKNFKRGHMVVVLSEVAGSAAGVEAVADSMGKLYRRMQKTWPTEGVVDDTVARTAGQVRSVSSELKKAIRAAQKAHQRELRLNAKGRGGKGARAERKWDVVGRRGSSE
ncbi:hypothetical protein ACH4GZ_39115 [Streptomyces hygroscopicus]|uniref:hypothetical protein n=1 Tax=Streptomyces hygroscopicus TaxID=1912 RepID=UPI003794C1C4